jgi:transglutaminase-like putative cysteine protease
MHALILSAFCATASMVVYGQSPQVRPAFGPPEQDTASQPASPQPKPAPVFPLKSEPASVKKSTDTSKEALVCDKLSTRLREESDGTNSREVTARFRILTDAGVKAMAVLTFTYTASSQQMEFGYVRVIKPDGSVVVTPDYNIQDLPAEVSRDAPMYSDVHEKHVAVKGLGVGDTLEYKVTQRTIKPDIPGQFWYEYSFESESIVLDEQLDLDIPADKSVRVTSADVQPTVTTSAGRKLYHWASANRARPDPDAPAKSDKNWKPSVQVTTFDNWQQVGAWYAALQKESLAVTPAIQAKAAALTKGATNDEQKVGAIFNDVALHIHYVGLEFGIGRYQPHPADDVLSNEYGDCKDKHTLLAAMLKAVGIDAWPAIISSDRPFDPSTPSPAQFDHVITVVPMAGKLLWMDSTEEVAPVGVLAEGLRDKRVLVIPTDKPAYLETTPADLPLPRSFRVEVNGSLSEQGQFSGSISETANGDVGMIFRSAFRQVPPAQWNELVQRIASSETFGGETSNPQVGEVEQIDQPFHFSFNYTREKYFQWDDSYAAHWIGPPMPLFGNELIPGAKEEKPADDPELGATGETVFRSTLQLPFGWLMAPPKDMTPPRNMDLIRDWAEYHSTYSFLDGVFIVERRLMIKKTKIPLEDWEAWLSFRKSLTEDEITQILVGPGKPKGKHRW